MAYPLGLSGNVTMCMVRKHISTVYKVTDRRKSLQSRGIRDVVWLYCLAVLIASPQNFFASGKWCTKLLMNVILQDCPHKHHCDICELPSNLEEMQHEQMT